jgi:adenylate cyclase
MRSSDVSGVQDWLLRAPHVDDGGVSFMQGLVEQLCGRGLPLWSCNFSLMTKHPELVWRTVQWTDGGGVKTIERSRETLGQPHFMASPFARLRQGVPSLRVRLDPGPLPFSICEELRARGATDYFAQALPFRTGETGHVSWATRAPGGFSDEALAALHALTAALGQRIELESAYHATRALLEVYLGRNAGRRVVEGGFRRGTGELIDAAIWFCDLRDFTVLSDEHTPEAVVQTLDEYFDRVAGVVMAAGGEVLKFIGDAILAIFPVVDDARAPCRNALAAAEGALLALRSLNEERVARGEGALGLGIALHRGRVMYGNIGARNRLDFTVISSSVNEACRLEALCKQLGTPLTLSEAFVNALELPGIVELGHHALKGVRAPIRVFTLASALSKAAPSREGSG